MNDTPPLRIAVAMSGGVDSSVTAALLKRQGHDVIGVTMRLYEHADADNSGNCASRALRDARAAADAIGIPHHVLDRRDVFRREVIDGFVDDYAAGRTPNPCAHCNAKVKFGDMLAASKALGAEAMATGHYVRRIAGTDGPELHCATDPARDQSYFLFATSLAQLADLRFPLGEMTKPAVRALAAEIGLANADKPDSQDICFVAGRRYGALIEEWRPEAVRPGAIVDQAGNRLGGHDGIVHFTVGQRKGLNIPGGGRDWFVLGLDAGRAEVTVGPREALLRHEIRLERVNWLTDPALAEECMVKVRSMRPAVPARVTAEGGGAVVTLAEPEEAVAPGQACVFYRGDRILGGGWIVA